MKTKKLFGVFILGLGLALALVWLLAAVAVSAGQEKSGTAGGAQQTALSPTLEISTTSSVVVIEGADPDMGAQDGAPDVLREIAGGDVNGDGFEDLILGAIGANPGGRWNAGEVYIFFGQPTELSSPLMVSTTADVTIEGVDEDDEAGYALASGDVDGDGTDDVIINAVWADPGGRVYAGEVYVVYGSSDLAGTVVISTTPDVLILEGVDAIDWAGQALASGDFDADGYADVIMGASWADPGGRADAGEIYVFYGRDRLTGTHAISTTADVLILEGVDDDDRAGGHLVSSDVDRDGYDDLIISAVLADPGGRSGAGEVYVVYGKNRLTGTHQISTTADVIIEGVDPDDHAGGSLASGDVDGDGYDDLILGASDADPGGRSKAGEVYVVYGASDLTGTHQISTTPGALILEGVDTNDLAGSAVACRDVNNDHFADIAVGAGFGDPGGRDAAGEVYVVYGSAGLSGTIPISNPGSVTVSTIQAVDEDDNAGRHLGIVDLNRDQGGEIVIGAEGADPGGRSNAGEVYVVYTCPDKYWIYLPLVLRNS
ncbi:MAG: hypothetical protein ACE5OS_10985 [Anaerolineae bacterium]